MRPSPRVSLCLAVLGFLLAAPLALAEQKKPAPVAAPATAPAPTQAEPARSDADTRQALVLTADERAHMLAGMRTYLEALQGVVESLAINKLDGVADSAKRGGAKMLQDAPATVPLKAPLAFTAMSLNTHEKFDILAERAAKSASRGEVLTALAEIMGNCTSCHATFRAVPAP